MADIRIGTSGWHYKHWLGTFYPAKTAASSMLAFYQTQFNTVELNNSFYHLPSKISLQSWRDGTPEDFQFAVKASRFLTHMKKLNDAGQGLERFLDTIEELGKKLGPILFQLPPNWDINVERFEKFVDLLPADPLTLSNFETLRGIRLRLRNCCLPATWHTAFMIWPVTNLPSR